MVKAWWLGACGVGAGRRDVVRLVPCCIRTYRAGVGQRDGAVCQMVVLAIDIVTRTFFSYVLSCKQAEYPSMDREHSVGSGSRKENV